MITIHSSEPTRQNILQLVSSGGSAHIQAGNILKNQHQTEYPQGINIETIDIMRSSCTYIPRFGKWGSDAWDKAQREGNVEKQKSLIALQNVSDKFFYAPTYFTVLNKLRSMDTVEKIELTVPNFLSAVCDAVNQFNREHGTHHRIDLHMVEPPTTEAIYYFRPLKRLNDNQRSIINLFALDPTETDLATFGGSKQQFWSELSGLNADQVASKPPVDPDFTKNDMPKPGQQVTLTLNAQNDDEEQFLPKVAKRKEGSKTFEFDIQANDHVGLVMLGSVPTKQAILDYVQEAMCLAEMNAKAELDGTNYLFVACGKAEIGLYSEVLELIKNYPQSSQLKIVPFVGQPVKRIFMRADFSITRTGGMTTQEIVAMKDREDPHSPHKKDVLIHAQLPAHISSMTYSDLAHRALALKLESEPDFKEQYDAMGPDDQQAQLEKAYNEYLVHRGIPMWEGGNAFYLCQRLGTEESQVVRPQTILPLLAKHFALNEGEVETLALDTVALQKVQNEIASIKHSDKRIRLAKRVTLVFFAVVFVFLASVLFANLLGVSIPLPEKIVTYMHNLSLHTVQAAAIVASGIALLATVSLVRDFRKKKKYWELVKL